MSKKNLPIILIIAIFCLMVLGISVYYFTNLSSSNNTGVTNNNGESQNNEQGSPNITLNLPTEGNDTLIPINSKSTLRVVNEYDKNFFTAEKNLLIMFGSWCANCQEEISEIEKILNHYKDIKGVNIVLIAHEFEETVPDLIDLLENDVDFGNVEVKIDLKRIIRKTIDPEASTIPISYVLDKKGNVLEIYNDSLTLNKAIKMVGK